MGLEKLSSLDLADELSLDDFDLQKIIIDKDIDGYCILKMSKEISQVYFPTARLLIKYENFRKKLLSKFCDVNDSMLNKDNTSVYTELTNYPSNYNQSGLIVQTHTSETSKISEQISDVPVNKENKLPKLKWPGYFVFPKEKLSDNLIKKLEDTQITIDEKDKREIATQIFNRLVTYELKEECYPSKTQYACINASLNSTFPHLVCFNDDIHKKITNKFRKLRRSSTIRDSDSVKKRREIFSTKKSKASSESIESEPSKDPNKKSKKCLESIFNQTN